MNGDQLMERLRAARPAPEPVPGADRLWAQITASARPSAPRHPMWRRIGTRGGLLMAGTTLVAAGAAAATLGLHIGAPVSAGRGASPTAGIGVPTPGSSRVLGLRAPDPAGGPPWGMRLVRTTRGLLCVQVGRIYRGRLGLLGIDGAFGDDGQFHPLPARALRPGTLFGDVGGTLGAAGSAQLCVPPTTTFSAFASELSRGGAVSRAGLAASELRWVSFGLLGAHARWVRYRLRGHTRTLKLHNPLGAYLVVIAGRQPGPLGGESGADFGQDELAAVRPAPAGAITAVGYRFGARTCTDTARRAGPGGCPTPSGPGAPPVASRNLHERIDVRLVRGHIGLGAIVSFRAPYAVRSALSSYAVEQPTPCHNGTIVSQVNRDLEAGQRVTVEMPSVFVNACGRTATLRVIYQPPEPGAAVVVGGAVVKRSETPRARHAKSDR